MPVSVHYDAVVIGSGQGGGPLAGALAGAGRKTAIIERKHVGGTCVNIGCTPTKTMVASARVAYLARRAADYGVSTGPVSVDLAAVRNRKRKIVTEFREGSESALRAAGVEIVMGEGVFTSPNTISVALNNGGTREIEADLITVNTGVRPALPPLPGLMSVPFYDSTSIMELDRVPGHLVVLGGGYVALEFAQMFRRFGSAVTVVERAPRLLEREDEDVSAMVTDILCDDGIDILVSSEAWNTCQVEPGQGCVRLRVGMDGAEREIEATHMLVAVGRRPNTDTLHPDAAGITTDKHGYIQVNDCLETGVQGIYALGDVTGAPAFTHVSYDDFRILRDNLLRGGNRSRAGRLIPYVMYIDPQLGRVGMSEAEARVQGRNIKVASMPMGSVARALEMDESRGFMKAVVDAESGELLGCAILGIEGGELMSMIEIAMMGGVTAPKLQDAIFAHPTLAESFNNLLGQLA